jgi:hypothetical protein
MARTIGWMHRSCALVLLACSLAMGLAALAAASLNDLRVLAVAVAVCAFVAGFLLRKRGALTGFGSVLLVSAAFPGCDPCGFVGYAGRMMIITLMSLGTLGLLAAVAGGLGELAARRARRQPSA